ncbi:hypothetical protein ACTA71_000733 [Dictyostelium dimigraforme]
METQTSFINDGPKSHSSKLNQLDFISGNNKDYYYNNNDKNSNSQFNNFNSYNYNSNKSGSSYDNAESARLIPISENFKNESNKQRRKEIVARVFIFLCLLICIGLALMGLFHYLITNDRRLDSISILFWSGSAFLIIVLIICLMAKHCGSD